MAAPPTDDSSPPSKIVARTLKLLRRKRGFKAADIARAMGIALRSYENFEGGKGRLNLDRVHQFARILNVDPFAILIAIEIRSPEFAVRCADSKTMSVLVIAVQEFDVKAGDHIDRLDPYSLMQAFTKMFDALAIEAKSRDAIVETWKAGNALRDATAAPGREKNSEPDRGVAPFDDSAPEAFVESHDEPPE